MKFLIRNFGLILKKPKTYEYVNFHENNQVSRILIFKNIFKEIDKAKCYEFIV